MEGGMKDTGKGTSVMGKDDCYWLMEIFMKETGLIIKWKETEFMNIKVEDTMQENGKIINNMVLVLNITIMEINMLVNIRMACFMEKACTKNPKVDHMMVIG